MHFAACERIGENCSAASLWQPDSTWIRPLPAGSGGHRPWVPLLEASHTLPS